VNRDGRPVTPVNFVGHNVLVTGASGFIGTHLCRRLLDAGAEVHALSRSLRSAGASPLRWWEGDVADIEVVRTLFRKVRPDTIYHLASHVMGAPNLEHVLPTFRANLQSSVNLLTVAAEHGCRRLVMTGSLAEPEPSKGEMFPVAPYAAAKWASSGYARMFHALYGVPAVLARVFMVYGPAQKDLSKLIPYSVVSLLRGKSPAISSGDRLVDWIYVDDVVEAYLALAISPGIEGQSVEIGSGKLVSIRDIVSQVAHLVGGEVKPTFGALPDRPMEPLRTADVAQTRERIGWFPTTVLTEGLSRTVDWYKAHLSELADSMPS
jgi:nucleoside-diphosphate-sugar epimerase